MNAAWLEADWPAPPAVRLISTFRGGGGAGVSTAPYESLNLGDHVGDEHAAVAENRRRLRAAAGLPSEPAWLRQVHGANVADLDASDPLGGADAAIARRSGAVCAILTADCLPIAFSSESGDRIAAAHGGWRGLAAGVIPSTVRSMRVAPEHLLVWLGPAISSKHFEVGAEVREAFLKRQPFAGEAFEPNARGRFMADLTMLARLELKALGIERIYGGGECTYARADRYFSYRRDGVTGRQATLIWREP